MQTVFVPPRLQDVWRWPAIANFTLGGAGAGLFLWSVCAPIGVGSSIACRFASAGCVALGLFCLVFEAGHPFRSRFLLRNLRRSWMSRESLAAAIFLPASMTSALHANPILLGVAAVAAFGFLLSQGFMVYRSRAIPAWNTPVVPLFFLSSGLATGIGLMLMIESVIGNSPTRSGALAAGLCLLADAIAWLGYIFHSKDEAFLSATTVLRRRNAIVQFVFLGRLFPVAALWAEWIPQDNTLAARTFGGFVALVIFFSGVAQKRHVLRKCAFLRNISLPFPNRRPSRVSDQQMPGAVATTVTRTET